MYSQIFFKFNLNLIVKNICKSGEPGHFANSGWSTGNYEVRPRKEFIRINLRPRREWRAIFGGELIKGRIISGCWIPLEYYLQILPLNIILNIMPDYYLWILSLDIKFLWNILLRMRFDKVWLIKAVGWPVGPSRTTGTVPEICYQNFEYVCTK